jgi:hypothetical protein
LSEEKKYSNYSAADIEKYHKGLLSPKEMNELEKAALDDPFLADALEGYNSAAANATADLSDLRTRLQQRVAGANVIAISGSKNSFKWWRVAAAVLIIGAVGFFTYRLSTSSTNNKVARVEDKKKASESTPAPRIDSITVSTPETGARVGSTKDTTKTVSASKRNSSKAFLKTTADKSNQDVAASIQVPPPAPKQEAAEASDTSVLKERVTATNEVLARAATKKPEANSSAPQGFAVMQEKASGMMNQQKVNYFRGRVVDANNNALPFANVTNTKSNIGTYADAKGNFTLISPDSTLDVQVRSVGFENNRLRLKNNIANEVIMSEDQAAADVVIGYKKSDATLYRKVTTKLEEPEPADGWDNYEMYLANNINLPNDLKKKENDGDKVQLSFDVTANGDPMNIKVERSLCQKCDEEAIRLVKEGPKWKRKSKKNKRATITVPFRAGHN